MISDNCDSDFFQQLDHRAALLQSALAYFTAVMETWYFFQNGWILKMISTDYNHPHTVPRTPCCAESLRIFIEQSIILMVLSDCRKWLRSAFPSLSLPPCSSVVWAATMLNPAVVAVSWTQSVCSELQTWQDSSRERNVPLCGVVWPEMPPQET